MVTAVPAAVVLSSMRRVIRSRGDSGSRSRSRRIVPYDSEEEKRSLTKGKSFEKENEIYRKNRNSLLNKLKPGDHIAAKRMARSYEHHGIYEGEDDQNKYPSVIHFQGPLRWFNIDKKKKGPVRRWFHKLFPSQTCIYKCGYEHPKKGKVVTSCIDCFSQRKTMFKMQYMLQKDLLSHQEAGWNELKPGKRIKGYRENKYYLEHYNKKDQLHGHSSDPITQKRKRSSQYTLDDQVRLYPEFSIRTSKEVLEEARKYKSPKYSLVCNNCEHFAVHCKTGETKSVQSQRCNAEEMLCENGKRKRWCC